MTPAEFVARHEAEWAALERQLATGSNDGDVATFPARYRRTCQHLALAQERHYPQDIIDRLNALALAGQQYLYRPRRRLGVTIGAFLAGGFARHVRRHPRALALALALFYVPMLAAMAATWLSPHLVYSVFDAGTVAGFEGMYDRSNAVIGYARQEDDNLQMFAYYIRNNVGIGFQTFAAGIFAGVGSLLILFYNALAIGMIAGFLTARGHGEAFWQFVCGHSAFELNAIALCAMAGLLLGHALIAPGRHLRRDALVIAARDAVPVLYGAAFMLFIAAVFEAFWSSRTIVPANGKFAMAALCWLLVITYFWRAGRAPPDRTPVNEERHDAP